MATPLSQIISIPDLVWEDRQPGVRTKSVWQDAKTKRRAIINRLEPGVQLPRHRHVGDELVFVIEGSIADEFGTLTVGNVGYRPDGCIHAVSSKNGATVLGIITGGVEPVTEGRGASSEIFTLSELPWVDVRPGVRHKKFWEDKTNERRALRRTDAKALISGIRGSTTADIQRNLRRLTTSELGCGSAWLTWLWASA